MASDRERLNVLETQLALEQLNRDFCYYLDRGYIDALVDLFTENAWYTHGERRCVGREQIRALFERRRAQGSRTVRHLQSGLQIRLQDDHLASGESICLTFAADGQAPVYQAEPYLVADFVDQYRLCADGRWRIAKRHIERIFIAPNNPGPVAATHRQLG